MTGIEPSIRLRGVGKSFAGISVLRKIDLDIYPGEILGLVGENGAGKSTLGKIVGGYYAASEGTVEAFGSDVGVWSPKEALERGVAIMHQELQLVPELTVAENVFLGIEEHLHGVLARTEQSRLVPIVESTGFEIDPAAKITDLPIADRQKIEIMRALARDAKVIVMDEPTSSLTSDEADRLHVTMRNLRAAGGTIVYVSHFLENILQVCDRITVLRDGDLVRTAPASGETKESLVSAMLGGGKTELPFPERKELRMSRTLLDAKGLSSSNGTRNASLRIDAGEIVGLIGLVGSGRSEIARTLIGADDSTGGEMLLDGVQYDNRSLSESTKRGFVMVPEDRRKQGLIMTLRLSSNMTLPHLSTFASRFGWIEGRGERDKAQEVIGHFDIRPSDPNGNVMNLSGGNQQKVLLGKWFLKDPKVAILDEPSRGVDVGARQRIHEAIAELAGKGTGVLLISSEIEEILGLAHRAYLVSTGTVYDEVDPRETSVDEVLRALFHLQDDSSSSAGESVHNA